MEMMNITKVFLKNRLFWKIGPVYLIMLLVVLASLDAYVVHALRLDHRAAAFLQLESLAKIALKKPPQFSDLHALGDWANYLSQGEFGSL
jgi:hypothetical protein